MERGLADSNWRIRENQVKRGVGRDLAARTKVRVGDVVCGCVRLGESQRPVVDVDAPHRGMGCSRRSG